MQRITFQQFRQKTWIVLSEEETFLIYRSDTNQILATGIQGSKGADE